jgi:hypothetical protein
MLRPVEPPVEMPVVRLMAKPAPEGSRTVNLAATKDDAPSVEGAITCAFRRCRPGIPIDVGHRFRSKPAGRSD